jgi:hypothetical protein
MENSPEKSVFFYNFFGAPFYQGKIHFRNRFKNTTSATPFNLRYKMATFDTAIQPIQRKEFHLIRNIEWLLAFF